MKKKALFCIRTFQMFFSKGITRIFYWGAGCRFQPSCSEYTYEAIGKYGTIKGLFLGIARIIRCNPFSIGGFDPVR